MEPNKKDGILRKDCGKLKKQCPQLLWNSPNYSYWDQNKPDTYSRIVSISCFSLLLCVCVHFRAKTAFGSLAKELMPEQYGVIYDVL